MVQSNSLYGTPKTNSANTAIENTPEYLVKIGEINELAIIEQQSMGLYLDDLQGGKILLPSRYVPNQFRLGENIKVFIYFDSEDRIIATTEKPKTQVGKITQLEVIATNSVGAFLDWGLSKDLLVPFSEQKQGLVVGDKCVVYTYLDKHSQRVVATTRLNRFIKDNSEGLSVNDKIKLIVTERTSLGYKVAINTRYWGVIHTSDIHQSIRVGQTLDGFVKYIREDKKVDVSLQEAGYGRVETLTEKILIQLEKQNGFLAIGDKSPAELIEIHFGVSKRAYKMAIGKLYKDRKINIDHDGIHLI
jgi:predicted RNA-binding protein (virulence factor B family)